MRGQAILAVRQPRLAALNLARATDRVRDEGEHVRAPDLRRARELGVLLVQERPQALERVVLVARGGVDVADALRVGLQIEPVDLAEALRDPRALNKLGRRQAPAPQPPLRAAPRAALQDALGAQHGVQRIQPARDALRDRSQVRLDDLLHRRVAAMQQHAQAE